MPATCTDIRTPLSIPSHHFYHQPVLTPLGLPGAALAQCLQNSDCVMIHRNTPADCLRPPLVDTLPTQCQQLKHGYGQCKRGMIDMRKRFRGNRPISTSTELEGSGKAPMLYAGKGTFDETEKKKKIEEGTEYEVFTRNDGSEDLRKK